MATRPKLPYKAPADILPAPLPTIADILASKDAFVSNHHVARVGEHFLVEYGANVRLQEGENMLFVQQATSVRVPTLYALFHDDESGYNFIVQEYIPGVTLEAAWTGLDTAKKEDVIQQLQRYFHELRRLPSPGYFCGVWEQDVIDPLVTNEGQTHGLSQPLVFKTEEQWVDGMLDSAQASYPLPDQRLKVMRRAYHAIFRNHKPVFTHGDLGSNIRMHPDGTVVLIDWERSGWHPSFWESCCFVAYLGYDDRGDWADWVPRFLPDEYFAELGWMLLFCRWATWGG